MKIETLQNNSLLYSCQNTSGEKKSNGAFKLYINKNVTTTDSSATEASDCADMGGLDVSGLLLALNNKVTEMKDKLKNGELEDKIQMGSTSYTDKDWDKLLEKFDTSEDALKKATAEEAQKAAEKAKAQPPADGQASQDQETASVNIVDHLYELLKERK